MSRTAWSWLAAASAPDGGGSLPVLPDDAPPWLIALYILAGSLVGLATLTAPYWGPALGRRLTGHPSSSATTSEDDTVTPKPTPGRAPPPAPAERHDAQMALIESLVDDLQANYARAESRAQQMSDRLAEAESDRLELTRRLESAEREKAALRAELDAAQATIRQLRDLLRPGPPTAPPGWPTMGPV